MSTNEELLVNFQSALFTLFYESSPGSVDWASQQAIVDEARAAVLSRMSPGWQPIETAPRDETDVLLFGKDGNQPRPPLVAGWFSKFTDEPGWYTHDDPDSEIDMEPTHWAPLPTAPESKP